MLIKALQYVVLPCVTLAIILVVWHMTVLYSGTRIFPSPHAVVLAFIDLSNSGRLWRYLLDSLARVGCGFACGVLVGVPWGLAMGWYPRAAIIGNPVVQLLRPISPLAWIPLAIIFFGISAAAVIFLIFLATVFLIALGAAESVRSVPVIYVRAGRNFGLKPVDLFLRIVLPATLPRIFTSLRIALGVGWLVVVAAEMIAVDSGLGYLILDARNAGKRYDLVVAGMLTIGAVGFFLDLALQRVERVRALRWAARG